MEDEVTLEECKPGVRVKYWPSGRERPGFVGVVREEPWQLASGHWVTHLHGMEPAYRNGESSTVYAAWVLSLEKVDAKCVCTHEAGDSPCPVHGEESY